MIKDNEKVAIYLESKVSSVFKILPLYEDKNIGLKAYIDSLLFELYGLQEVTDISDYTEEYMSVLVVLGSIKKEIVKSGDRKVKIKREVFKSISIIKNIIIKIENGD